MSRSVYAKRLCSQRRPGMKRLHQRGAALPFGESQIMEHGLLMLAGAGIYRLDADWYPVQAGDVIWMACYCPQWFDAVGDTPPAMSITRILTAYRFDAVH